MINKLWTECTYIGYAITVSDFDNALMDKVGQYKREVVVCVWRKLYFVENIQR